MELIGNDDPKIPLSQHTRPGYADGHLIDGIAQDIAELHQVLQAGHIDTLGTAGSLELNETSPDIMVFHTSSKPGQNISNINITDVTVETDEGQGIQLEGQGIQLEGLCEEPTKESNNLKTNDTAVSEIIRKYKRRREQTNIKSHKHKKRKHFVCEHCGLVSRCEKTFNKKSRLSGDQGDLTQALYANMTSVSSKLLSSPKDNSNIVEKEHAMNIAKSNSNRLPGVRLPATVHSNEKGSSANNGEPKPYMCGKCSQGFLDVAKLVKHVSACDGVDIKGVSDNSVLNNKHNYKTSARETFKEHSRNGVKSMRKEMSDECDQVGVRTRSRHKLGYIKPKASAKEGRKLKVKGTQNRNNLRTKFQVSSEKVVWKQRPVCKARSLVASDGDSGINDNAGDWKQSNMTNKYDENEGRKQLANTQKRNIKKYKRSSAVCNPNNECSVCHKNFSQRSSLYRHDSLVHKGVKKHECHTCHKRFQQKHNLTIHKCLGVMSLVSKSLLCIMCGKNFANVSSLNHHERTLHIKAKHFSCPTCNRVCSSAGNMREHVRAVHSGRKYLCALCGKSFSFKNSYNRHQRYHAGLKPYNCKHCTRKFSTTRGRQLHEITHTVAEKVQCEYCGKRMKNLGCVMYHMKRYHGNAESKTFQCYRCGTMYATKLNLERHMEDCQKNQDACQYCFKTFSSKSNLAQHLKTHTSIGSCHTAD